MKVLHIGEYVSGGVATYLRTLVKNAEKYKVEQYLLMSDYKSEKNWGLDPNRVFYYSYRRSPLCLISAIKSTLYHIKKIKPDIIHVHSSWAGVFARLPYLFIHSNAKIVYSAHGWAFLMDATKKKKTIYRSIEKLLSLVTDKIINISNFEHQQAIKFGFGEKKMIMIYNGVDDTYKQNNCMKIKVDASKINLLFVGRIDKQKGLDLFLEAYYGDYLPQLHLYVIGESVLENLQLESDAKVTYLGWVDACEMDGYYQACDVVVMPSRWEGFGLVAAEAMRNKKPVLASKRGALPELIQDGENGYLFDLYDSEKLKNILSKLNKNTLKIMGEKGRSLYVEKFRADVMRDKTYQLYNSIMKI